MLWSMEFPESEGPTTNQPSLSDQSAQGSMVFISEIGMSELIDAREIQGAIPWSSSFSLEEMEIRRGLTIIISHMAIARYSHQLEEISG